MGIFLPSAYASLYSYNVAKTLTDGEPLKYDFKGLESNACADLRTNCIKIEMDGVYQITADVKILQGSADFEIRRNNDSISGSIFTAHRTSGSVGKVIQAELAAGDRITVVPVTINNADLYASNSLTVLNIDAL